MDGRDKPDHDNNGDSSNPEDFYARSTRAA